MTDVSDQQIAAPAATESVTWRAKIVRNPSCPGWPSCMHPSRGEAVHTVEDHAAMGFVEDLGVVSYWHRNPLRRLLHKITGRV